MNLSSNHDILVSRITEELRKAGDTICSPRSWIRGPVQPDIITYYVHVSKTHPVLKIIEVKDNMGDLQRAITQLLISRSSLTSDNKDMYAFFYTAISQKLYKKLIEFNHLDWYLSIFGDTYFIHGQHIPVLGFGLSVVNENDKKPWKNQLRLIKAEAQMV